MVVYLITRHPGSLDWLKNRFGEPVVYREHLDHIQQIKQGDTVVGTLPVNLIAEVCNRGARYWHLEISIPQSLRGKELTVQQLHELGAELVEYVAYRPCSQQQIMQHEEREA